MPEPFNLEPNVVKLWNGTPGGVEMQRTPSIYKGVLAGVGAEQTIWTPAAGKRFRLLGFIFYTTTAAGAISLKDGTGGTTFMFLPNVANNTMMAYNLPGNGYLSTTINNVMTATGVATQILAGTMFGTEE